MKKVTKLSLSRQVILSSLKLNYEKNIIGSDCLIKLSMENLSL